MNFVRQNFVSEMNKLYLHLVSTPVFLQRQVALHPESNETRTETMSYSNFSKNLVWVYFVRQEIKTCFTGRFLRI